MGCMVRGLPFSAVTGKRHQLLLMTLSHRREKEGGGRVKGGGAGESDFCQVPNITFCTQFAESCRDEPEKILHIPQILVPV